jgi:hypothetical protein
MNLACYSGTNERNLMTRQKTDDTSILEAALMGLEHQHRTITDKIGEIRKQLGIKATAPMSGDGQPPMKEVRTRRRMSAAARKRIGEATRRRWAAYRKTKAKAAK